MGNADGEDQERHQHRVRIQAETGRMHQPQLPDHRHQGGGQYRDGTAHAVGEPVQQDQGDNESHAEEQHHHDQAVDQVADLLGETDDMDLHVGVLGFELVADLVFKLVGKLPVVEGEQFALVLQVGIGLQQRDVDDARLEVVGHQAPDLAGLEHVITQQIEAVGRTVVALGDHLAAGEALLRHFGPAHARAPQRLEPGTVDAGDVEDLIVDLTQGLHVFLGEDVAVGGLHGNTHRVAQVRQVVAVLEHLLDEGVLEGDHFFETGGRPDQRGLPEQENADQQANDDHCRAVVENQALEERRLVLVMTAHGVRLLVFVPVLQA